MTEQVRMFLEYANEAATKIREIYHIFGEYGDESSQKMVYLVMCMIV